MGDTLPTSVDERWQGLRNSLAGLFCASLGHLDDQRTTSPTLTFQPEGSLPNFTYPHQLRHATLPSEHVCTENLTPFLKLLPCKSLSGIAHLLNPHRVFDADWHGLGVHVRYRERVGVEVRLAFQAVFDPVRYSHDGRRDHEPLDVAMKWPDENSFAYREHPIKFVHTDFADIDSFAADTSKVSSLTDISVRRNLKGTSQADAHLTLEVTNNLPVRVKTGYLETMPWHLQFYLHTLCAHVDDSQRGKYQSYLPHTGVSILCPMWLLALGLDEGTPIDAALFHRPDDLVNILSYTPPVPHSRPALLQAVLTLPPHTTLRLTMDVSKPFLRYTEHPPDAQRGWDLPPAVLVPFAFGEEDRPEFDPSPSNEPNSTWVERRVSSYPRRHSRPRRIYTPVMLVDLATPDFSMPYNVIIMSCTLIALIFGSVFNLLTRRFVVVPVDPGAADPEKDAAEEVAHVDGGVCTAKQTL
ncbi:hypothetical protein BN946_scf184970.g112 [Trametes cinnabarina]|uniref:GPI transamidase component PIG-T n=1 Tax=Pycnoporus cinnabarinus TaxID=5643 RepID=A0A060SD32_PYCCI|nr:hypothetical protein BN946_scf184970.g112 [Trametes cinnabarina]